MLIQFLSRVQSQSHPEKDLMGSFSNPFGGIRAGFDNRCQMKRVQGVHVCVVIHSTILDCIIPTLLAFTQCAVLVKGPLICIWSLLTMAKLNIFCYAPLLNQFRVNKGYTHSQYFVYGTVSHCSYFRW